jgi:hypothetical protein
MLFGIVVVFSIFDFFGTKSQNRKTKAPPNKGKVGGALYDANNKMKGKTGKPSVFVSIYPLCIGMADVRLV